MRRLAAIACLLSAISRAEGKPPPWMTGESRGEDLAVLLVTFGPGDQVVEWFGHTALAIEDRRLQHGRLYNYGYFSFGPGMLWRYALGYLTFWVGEDPIVPVLEHYKRAGRDVRIQELNLSPARRLKLAQALATNALPKNREYLYHHYRDNCATRPRDMIDQVLSGQLKRATSVAGRMTLRDHTRRYSAAFPPMSVLLDFLMNDEIDREILQWDEAFLPAELERQVAALSITREDGQNVPLVGRAWTYFDAKRPEVPERPPSYGPWLLSLGLVLGGLPWALRKRQRLLGAYNAFIGLLFGLPGLVLFLMWVATEHTVTWRNENLLLANPLTFALLPLGLGLLFGAKWAAGAMEKLSAVLSAMALLGLLLKVLPAFDQDNWRLIALLLPLNLGNSAAFLYERLLGRQTSPRAMALGSGMASPSEEGHGS